MVEYVIKLESSRYYFVPVPNLSRGDWFLAPGEPRRAGGFNTAHRMPVRTYPIVVEVSNVAAPVDLPMRHDRLDHFQIGKPGA